MNKTIIKVKPQFHIITCGTSILNNYINKTKDSDEIKIDLETINSITPSNNLWVKIRNILYEFLEINPTQNSAEYNSLSYFLNQYDVKKLYLISTDTNAGKLCVTVLKDFLKKQTEISDINFKEAKGFGTENFEDGILEIRNTLLRLIKNHRNDYDIYLNATGGFKPESAAIVLIGSLYLIPVYYIYETSKKLVYIPPFPLLFIDKDYFEIIQQLIKKPEGIRERNEVKAFENKFKNKLTSLKNIGAIEIIYREDGSAQYSILPIGKFLYDFKIDF